MNYDSSECLACYGNCGGNDMASRSKYICFSCIDNLIDRATSEVRLYISDNIVINTKCYHCNENKTLLVYTPLCEYHVEYLKSVKDIESDVSYEDENEKKNK